MSCRVTPLSLFAVGRRDSWCSTRVATVLRTKSSVLHSMQEIQSILLRQLVSGTCILLSVSTSKRYVSHSYIRMGTTRDFCTLHLLANRIMLLSCKSYPSCPLLMRCCSLDEDVCRTTAVFGKGGSYVLKAVNFLELYTIHVNLYFSFSVGVFMPFRDRHSDG